MNILFSLLYKNLYLFFIIRRLEKNEAASPGLELVWEKTDGLPSWQASLRCQCDKTASRHDTQNAFIFLISNTSIYRKMNILFSLSYKNLYQKKMKLRKTGEKNVYKPKKLNV